MLDFSQIHTIAIVGLSPDSSKDSNMVARYLLAHHFCIIPIYPKQGEILGQRVYTSLREALDSCDVDMVVVFRKSEACVQIAQEVLESKHLPKVFWLQLGIENEQAKQMLESKGIQVVQNHCVKIEYAQYKNKE